MSDWDPADQLAEDDRHEWEMAGWLRAQRRLRSLDESRPSGRQLLTDTPSGTRCCRAGCNSTDVRLIRLTGDQVCGEHDPLRAPHWGRPCCSRKD